LRCPATVRPTSGLHRRLTLRPRFPIDLRLASAINLSAMPSNSTSNSHRLSDPPAWFPIDLQLAPSTEPQLTFRPTFDSRLRSTFQLSHCIDLATRVACRSSGPAFRPISSLRLRSIFQLHLPADLRLASPINLPALPLNLTSDSHRLLRSPVAFESICGSRRDQILQLAFAPICGFRHRLTLQLYLPARLRLAPAANLPASPLNPTSDSHRILHS